MRVSGGTQIFDKKMNINFATTLDPYAINNAGKRIDTWNINNGGSLFRMTSANMTLNYSFSNSSLENKDKENTQGKRNGGRTDDLFGTNTDLADSRQSQFKEGEEKREPVSELFNYKLPFDVNFAYSLTYSNINREKEITGNSVMVS